MPIEIRELVVRAVVEPPAGGCAPDRAGAGEPADQAKLVQACVAEVMRQLRRAQEP